MGLQISFGDPKEWIAYDTQNHEEIIKLTFKDGLTDKEKWKQIYTEVAKYYFKIDKKMYKAAKDEADFIKWFIKKYGN